MNKQLNPDLEKQLVENINEAEWIELTKEMVAIGQPRAGGGADRRRRVGSLVLVAACCASGIGHWLE